MSPPVTSRVGSVPPASSPRAGAPPAPRFAGRTDELAAMERALADATERLRVVMVSGDPGIGKTRVAEEVARRARDRGAAVFMARCPEDAGAPAFWPWVQVYRAYVETADDAALAADLGWAAADVAQLLPEVGERLKGLAAPLALEPAQARFRLFDGLAAFLTAATRRRPFVLVLDDLHAADEPSLLFLEFLAREADSARLLVVGTYRDGEVRLRHPLARTVGELARHPHFLRLPLLGLDAAAVADVLRSVSSSPAPPGLVEEVYRRTEGNALFVGEIARLLAGADAAARATLGPFAVPAGVREAIARRVARLSPACAELLSVASVVGREFGLRELERATGLAVARVLALLEESEAARLVQPGPRSVGRWVFAHALLRDTLYEAIEPAARVALHARVGRALESLQMPLREAHLAALAYHFARAASAGDAERAIRYTRQVAVEANGRLAYEKAAEAYEDALALQAAARPGAHDERCGLLLALGDACDRAGDLAKTRAAYSEAAALARTLGDGAALARVALGWGGRAERTALDPAHVALLEEALVALGAEASPLRAMTLARLGEELAWTGDLARPTALVGEALALAHRLGDAATLAYVLAAEHVVLFKSPDVQGRLAAATRIVELGRATRDAAVEVTGHIRRFGDMFALGDMAGVEATVQATVRLARELRQPLYLQWAALHQSARAQFTGRFDEAAAFAEEALAVGQRVEPRSAFAVYGATQFERARALGQLDGMDTAIAGAIDAYPELPAMRCALALVYMELDRDVECRRELDVLAARGFRNLPHDFSWVGAMSALAEVCGWLGDATAAAELERLLAPFRPYNVVAGRGIVVQGAAAHYLGLLAVAQGHLDDAVRDFAAALAMNRRTGGRPFVARTEMAYAACLLARGRRGDVGKARRLLASALAGAEALGMPGLVVRARKLADEAAATPTGLRGVVVPFPITRRG